MKTTVVLNSGTEKRFIYPNVSIDHLGFINFSAKGENKAQVAANAWTAVFITNEISQKGEEIR